MLLNIQNIKKSFGLNKVLKSINMSLRESECLAIIGGNGAGKSTLVKIIMSIYKPDSGSIKINDESLNFSSPSESLNKKIYLIPQEPMLFPNMSLRENVIIGINKNEKQLNDKLESLNKELGYNLDLDRKALSLTIAEQQLVEIFRGLLREAKILILDEPTSALTFDEVASLFKIIKDLKKANIGLIYITHRLSEVFEIATHVALMKDGQITSYDRVENFDKQMLVEGLLAEDKNKIENIDEESHVDYSKDPIFTLNNYSGYGFDKINLNIYPGEILGMAGVVGAGRTEMAMSIFGKSKALKGKAELQGKDVTNLNTKKVIKAGINYIPEDRFLNGIFKITDVKNNLSSAALSYLSKIFLSSNKEKDITGKYVDDFRIKITDQSQVMGSLSGGNQQKVVIGRGLSTKPKLIILDEPTRGIDAGARSDVYRIIKSLKKSGVAILLISSDIEEIVKLSDRALSIFQGRVNKEFKKDEINEDALMKAAFGVI